MNNSKLSFEQFMKRRETAAHAYVQGNPAPLGRMVTHHAPATFFAPMGGFEQGADAVSSKYEHDAGSFRPGGDSHFEILQMEAGDDIAFWVGFQRATAQMEGSKEAVPFNLRITEVFRREGDDWKLVHRHADSLIDAPSKDKKKAEPVAAH